MGKRGTIWSLPCHGRNTSFHAWQVVSPLRECLCWLCQNPAVMEEECRRIGHKSTAPLLLPRKRNADLSLPTGWELPAPCLFSGEKDTVKREWEEGCSTFIHTDAILPYCCRRFSTIFLYLEEERCSKKAPFSIMALFRYVCVLIVHPHVSVIMKTCLSVRYLS